MLPLHTGALQSVVCGRLQGGLRRLASEDSYLTAGRQALLRLPLLCFGTLNSSSNSSNSSMLLQSHRRVAASATASGSAPITSSLNVQRKPTRLYVTSNKKAKGACSSSGISRASAAVPKQLVLNTVPGIGKVYMEKLQGKGISSIDQLADSILKELSRSGAETSFLPAVKYLQGLGIRRQDHAQRIVKHITAKFDQDLYSRLQEFEGLYVQDSRGGLITTPPLTLCVEGNISAGKSTFLQYITNNNEELQQQLGVVHEPVEEWQKVPSGPNGKQTLNLLDKFYQDPQKYAYTFQNYVFMSRVMQERKSVNIQQPVRLMERSVFSDRMVFVRAVKESGWMGDVELAVYDSWFGPILDSNPSLVPDGFIYLRCKPDTCMERLKMRARSEETTVGMDYLEGLHDKHEDWLRAGPNYTELRRPRRRDNSVVLPNGLLLPGSIPANLRESLYVLDNDKSAPEMHKVLNGVPALVLECDGDVLRDMDLQRHVQQTVADYINLMRQHRAQREKQKQLELKASSSRASSSGAGAGSSFSDRRRRSTVRQAAPEGVKQAVDLVKDTAGSADFQVVPKSSGQLQDRGAAVSGGLEALHTAVQQGKGSRMATV